MKLRISILMVFSFLIFFSCQQEESLLEESPQMEDIKKRNNGQPIIFVHWGEDQNDPVQGALVFNLETNELIAETDGEGNAYINPEPGAYRVVDPNYGAQQAIVHYPEDFEYDEQYGAEREVIGWTMDGKPIYADE